MKILSWLQVDISSRAFCPRIRSMFLQDAGTMLIECCLVHPVLRRPAKICQSSDHLRVFTFAAAQGTSFGNREEVASVQKCKCHTSVKISIIIYSWSIEEYMQLLCPLICSQILVEKSLVIIVLSPSLLNWFLFILSIHQASSIP